MKGLAYFFFIDSSIGSIVVFVKSVKRVIGVPIGEVVALFAIFYLKFERISPNLSRLSTTFTYIFDC